MCGAVQGMDSICVRAFAEAMEVVPYTLAENAGLNPIQASAAAAGTSPAARASCHIIIICY